MYLEGDNADHLSHTNELKSIMNILILPPVPLVTHTQVSLPRWCRKAIGHMWIGYFTYDIRNASCHTYISHVAHIWERLFSHQHPLCVCRFVWFLSHETSLSLATTQLATKATPRCSNYIIVSTHYQPSARMPHVASSRYEVATVSRIDKILGLFCRMLSLLKGSFAKET